MTWELVIHSATTIAIGIAGAFIGTVLRLPAGALVGSMLAVAFANIFISQVEIVSPPPQIRLVLQVALGIILGSRFTQDTFLSLKELWQPALLGAAIAISTGILTGLLISRYLGVEKLTAFLGSAPGGMTDMSLIALDLGAGGSLVLVMHLVRLLCVITIIPLVVRLVVQSQGG